MRRRTTIKNSTESVVEDCSVFSADDLLNYVERTRGANKYEMFICGKQITGTAPILSHLEELKIQDEILKDAFLEVVVKTKQVEEELFTERLFNDVFVEKRQNRRGMVSRRHCNNPLDIDVTVTRDYHVSYQNKDCLLICNLKPELGFKIIEGSDKILEVEHWE